MSEESTNIAVLSYHLFVDCPKCNEQLDLSDSPHDDEGYFSTSIFNNRWSDLDDSEVTCEHCNHQFTVAEIIY